ncbi:hypothetical protein BDY19DRAFT_998035 [Irpex rosettiformis]|uniref:Uncharacterized protein n=1 Tax=Irpex rosettiformis TaxID=378272 RepID=A0ACB8TQ27_9APHY|nr:hypothetical protein BDY19DRAFT_998035 [Irpex rosettiformis]
MPTSGPIKACDLFESVTQTVTYGVFIFLLLVATCLFLERGFKKKSNTIIFAVTIVAFVLSTCNWIATTATFIVKIISIPSGDYAGIATAARLNFNAIILVNLLFADGVVIWRMKVLCQNYFSWKVLALPLVLLVITSLSVIATIGIRMYDTIVPTSNIPHDRLTKAVNFSQVTTLVFSLATNMVATSIITRWAWFHWQNTRVFGSILQLNRVPILLVESGAIYCLSSAITLISFLIRLGPLDCTLGDIFSPVQSNLAGIYPVLTMILVNLHSTSSIPISNSKSLIQVPRAS